MAHLHSIYDNDAHFCIDPVTRRIKEDTSLKTLLAQGDHNSERFTFELPRIIEGHDMSLCDKVEIHYLNGTNPGVYEVDDLQISPESEDVVIFSWLISNNATQLAATLAFAIKLACTTDGVVDYAYNTLPYDKVTVGKSINNGEVIIQEYADILAQWKQELSDAATNAEVDATLTVCGKAADAKATGDAIRSLSEKIVNIPSGKNGKSAYAYAVEGGYTGTEEEFAAKLAAEMPDALPNPNALTLTGAVTGSYDGSAPLSVEIPSVGGGRTLELIADVTTAEETTMISITKDSDGNAFKVKSWAAYIYIPAHKRDTAKPFYARGSSYGGGMTFANMLVTSNRERGFFLYPIANYDAQDALDMDHPLKVQYISSFGGNTADTAVGFDVNLSIFQVYTNNANVLFPAGVRVRLWGVRT